MITFKKILQSVVFLILPVLTFAKPAFGGTSCRPTPQGNLCVSQVDFAKFAQTAFQRQRQSEWCWATCISMIFNYYGHPVSQERIVATVYGKLVDAPAGAGWVIARQLNRDWVDDKGKPFKSRLDGVFDLDAGVMGLNNIGIINALDQNRPLVVASGTHAVVGTAIQYYALQAPYVVGIGVFDPWPFSPGARGLSQAEMTPMNVPGGGLRFVASIVVTD